MTSESHTNSVWISGFETKGFEIELYILVANGGKSIILNCRIELEMVKLYYVKIHDIYGRISKNYCPKVIPKK